MKLTTAQIESINQTLMTKGIKFDDLKIEVLDHIALQIESEMETSQITFAQAFNQVFDQWEKDLKPTRAFFSLTNYYPKLARSKFGNQIKLEIGIAIAIISLLIISFQLVSDSNAKVNFILCIKKIFNYTYYATIVSVLVLKFLNKKSTVSSTYKHTFDKRFYAIILWWLMIVLNDKIPQDITNQNVMVSSIGFSFVFLFTTIYLGFKHYQFQKKFSIQS
jgi:hypothetical protein